MAGPEFPIAQLGLKHWSVASTTVVATRGRASRAHGPEVSKVRCATGRSTKAPTLRRCQIIATGVPANEQVSADLGHSDIVAELRTHGCTGAATFKRSSATSDSSRYHGAAARRYADHGRRSTCRGDCGKQRICLLKGKLRLSRNRENPVPARVAELVSSHTTEFGCTARSHAAHRRTRLEG